MLAYAFRRIGLALAVSLAVSVLSFALLRLSGDAAMALAGDQANALDVERIRAFYNLDRPPLEQFGGWLLQVLHGDFGQSYYFRLPVLDLIRDKIGVTLALATGALLVALILGVMLGIVAAVCRDRWPDRLIQAAAILGQSVPSFFLALLLIMVFGVWLRWLPVSGGGSIDHLVLPSVALGVFASPVFLRIVRSSMIDALNAGFIRTARAKGLPWHAVVLRHALPNALVPVVALTAVQFGHLLGGSVVIETIFALDGLGYLAYQAITHSDVPVTQAILSLSAVAYAGLTLLADLVNGWLDPRIGLT